jgi:competence protein ComEA
MDTSPTSSATSAGTFFNTSREAQVALGVLLILTMGLLAFRGYGNGLRTHPTDVKPHSLDLNRAERTELEQVPGIGPTLAKSIDDYRRRHGPFQSVDELQQVKGIGPATLNKVRLFFHVEPEPPAPPNTEIPEPLVLERKPATPGRATRPAGLRKLQPGDPPINVNSATLEELMQLPGVGAVTAQNIIAARSAEPFRTLADLDRVKNIGPKTLDKLRPFVVFEPPSPLKPK